MAEPLRWTTALLATAASLCLVGQWSHPVAEVGDQAPVVVEDRLEPTDFTPEELKLLQRRFGVHGPQTQLAQLFTSGMDQLQPLRASTLDRLRELKPVILRQAAAHGSGDNRRAPRCGGGRDLGLLLGHVVRALDRADRHGSDLRATGRAAVGAPPLTAGHPCRAATVFNWLNP